MNGFNLIPQSALNEAANILEKYSNKGYVNRDAAFSELIGKMMKQISKINNSVDYDEDGELLASKLMCNAMLLVRNYKERPWLDDRKVKFSPRITLDIDDVLACFTEAYRERYGIPDDTAWTDWNFRYDTGKNVTEELANDKDFWLNLKLKDKPNFTPIAYVTSRCIPTEWTMEWIEKVGLPACPVYTVGHDQSKVEVVKSLDVNIHVDDAYKNFKDLTEAGIFCYLYDCEWNAKYDVQHRRVFNLKQICG